MPVLGREPYRASLFSPLRWVPSEPASRIVQQVFDIRRQLAIVMLLLVVGYSRPDLSF